MDLFAQEGYTVVATFAEPVTDPHVIEHNHPDIVIMDWLFGDKGTGLRTLELLTTYPPTADIPIIVCTTLRTLRGRQHFCSTRCATSAQAVRYQ